MWPLNGVKVIDMTQNVAGPYAGMILAEFGADVIKVEPPGGDVTRAWGPPFWEGESPTFMAVNRNKTSLTLNLKLPEDKARMLELIQEADVFLQSGRPGSMERLGLDYPSLKKINPKLIYGEVTAFGHQGPRSQQGGYDPLMQALGGIMSVTGHQGQPPVRVGVSIVDMATGMWLALGVMGALIQRQTTGEGCRVTSSLYETAIAWMSYHIGGFWGTGASPTKWGSGAAMIAPYEAFPTADKWIIIAAGNDHLFSKLCAVLDKPEWLEMEQFKTNEARVKNRAQLREWISEMTKQRDSTYWIALLEAHGIPVAPVLNVEEVVQDPQFAACGIVQHVEHPRIKEFRSIGLPISINDERPPLRKIPPQLSQ